MDVDVAQKVGKQSKTPPKRDVEVVILSDFHLGTYGCNAPAISQYLKTIKPKMVVLNGDIIDIWQFSKRYWPSEHMMVIKQLVSYIAKDIPVYYIPGNHDDMLRRFVGFHLGSLQITNKLSLKLDDTRTWIFHGDVFDVVMEKGKWLAKLGAVGYGILILINNIANFFSVKLGYGKLSFAKKIKSSVKGAVKKINNFEGTICEIAAENKYDYVAVGHIHQPEIRNVLTKNGPITYLNSGDWIANLTALEYNNKVWSLYRYNDDPVAQNIVLGKKKKEKESSKVLHEKLMVDLNVKPKVDGVEEYIDDGFDLD